MRKNAWINSHSLNLGFCSKRSKSHSAHPPFCLDCLFSILNCVVFFFFFLTELCVSYLLASLFFISMTLQKWNYCMRWRRKSTQDDLFRDHIYMILSFVWRNVVSLILLFRHTLSLFLSLSILFIFWLFFQSSFFCMQFTVFAFLFRTLEIKHFSYN